MPAMLVVFDQDGMPLDVKGVRLVDEDLVASIAASYWRVSGEAGEALGARVSRVSIRAGTLRLEMSFGAEAGYVIVVDEGLAELLDEEVGEGAEDEWEDITPAPA